MIRAAVLTPDLPDSTVPAGRSRPSDFHLLASAAVPLERPAEHETSEDYPMATLKAGIADYEEMKDRSLRIARGEEKPAADEPKVWFNTTESFARILTSGNRELLHVISERKPQSLEELSEMTGKAMSNLSRTLKKMASLGLVSMEKDGRKVAPKLLYDRVVLELPLTKRPQSTKAAGG